VTLFKPVFRFLLVAVVALTTASCGFALRDSYNLPDEVTQVSLTSVDPYGELTRQLRNQLNQHKVELVAPANTVTNIHLLGESNSEQTLSLYQNSRVAEKEFRYVARYRVTVPQKGSYPLTWTMMSFSSSTMASWSACGHWASSMCCSPSASHSVKLMCGVIG